MLAISLIPQSPTTIVKSLHVPTSYEALVYKLVHMKFRTSSLQISPLVNGQHMGHPSSCIWDLFWYRTSHDYWMISSGVKVKLGSRMQFRGHSWWLQGVIAEVVRVKVKGAMVLEMATIMGAIRNATGAMSWVMLHPSAWLQPWWTPMRRMKWSGRLWWYLSGPHMHFRTRFSFCVSTWLSVWHEVGIVHLVCILLFFC